VARFGIDLEPAADRGQPIGKPAQAGAAVDVRAAHPIVADLDHEPVGALITATVARLADAYLATFVSASETTK
jgi:hypothetical protein